MSVTERDLFDFLLKQGWLEKHRAGEAVKKEWLKQLNEENKKKVEELKKKGVWEDYKNRGEGSLNFFRSDSR